MALSLADFLAAAFTKGCEGTIRDIAGLFELPLGEHPFEVCLQVEQKLAAFGLSLIPALPKGDLDSPRLVIGPQNQPSIEDCVEQIQQGEGPTTELKSTFMFHVDRAANDKNATLADLKSQDCIHSCLKTVAAFLNTSGGFLFVGVDDTGTICGIERDYVFFPEDKGGRDAWELEFRNHIHGRFHDGLTVNSFVRIDFVEDSGKALARIAVSPRRRVSYLKHPKLKDSVEVYVRQGNQSVSLNHYQFEEFLDSRRK